MNEEGRQCRPFSCAGWLAEAMFTKVSSTQRNMDLMPTARRRSWSHANQPRIRRRSVMNKDIISGKWTQLKGKVQAKWGDITDDDMKVAEGNAEYLAGRLQERYGWAKDRAETEVRDFQKALHKDYPDYH
jgi:uncharacterized protein YjbJ (UPF0337 family)